MRRHLELSVIASARSAGQEKVAAQVRPWIADPGPFANLAGELDEGDGFSVSDLRAHLRDARGREGRGWPFKSKLTDAEAALLRSPKLQASFVQWARGQEKVAGKMSALAKRLGEVGVGGVAGGTLAFATHGDRPDETQFQEALVGIGAGGALTGTVAALGRQHALRRFTNPNAYKQALTSKLRGIVDSRAKSVEQAAMGTISQAKARALSASEAAKRTLGRRARAAQAEQALGPKFDALRGRPSAQELNSIIDDIAQREGQHPHAVLHGISGGMPAVNARIRAMNAARADAERAMHAAASPEEALHHAQVRDYHAQVADALQQFKADVTKRFQDDWGHRAGVARTKLVGAREAQAIATGQAKAFGQQARAARGEASGALAWLAAEQRRLALLRKSPNKLLAKGSPLTPKTKAAVERYARKAEEANLSKAKERAGETFFGFGG